jgi:hypothetical protein
MLAEGSINPSMTKVVADTAVWLEKRRHERREQEREPLDLTETQYRRACGLSARPHAPRRRAEALDKKNNTAR